MSRKPADIAIWVVFLAWLIGAPLLLGIGLLRRIDAGSVTTSIPEAIAYADTTDAYLLWGLVLNAGLPFMVAVLAGLTRRWQRWRWLAVSCAVGAVLLFAAFGVAGAFSDAPLFGHWPRIEKP